MEIHICDYGCGQEATFQIGKRWCCSKSFNSCPAKKVRKVLPREKPDVCDFGCGQEPKFKLKNGKWCCSKSQNSCPAKKEKSRENRIGVKNLPAQPIETEELCSFGCGQKASYKYQNGSYCCSYDWHKCPGKHEQISKQSSLIWSDLDRRRRLSEIQKEKDLVAVAIPVLEDNKVCQDCGQKANFWFKTNNRYCCSDRIERCPAVKDEIRQRMLIQWEKEEFRELMKSSQIYDEQRSINISISQKEWFVKNPGKEGERAKGLIQFSKDHAGESLEEKYGIEIATKIRKKASERALGKTWEELYGKEKSDWMKENQSQKLTGRKETRLEVLLDMSMKKKGHWNDPNTSYNSKEFRDLKSKESKQHWKDPEYIKKIQVGLHNSPNGPERILIEIIELLNLDYDFVGDWKITIDGKNPDFINYSKHKIIEHFGIYYHDTIVNLTREEHEQERIKHFTKNGYECLIIWEDELQDIDKVKEKILKFDQK